MKNLFIKQLSIVFFTLLFSSSLLGDGLTGNYYDNDDFSAYQLTRIDSTIDFSWGNGSPDSSIGANNYSVEWTGYIYFPEDSSYTFSLAHDDTMQVIIDGTSIYNETSWTGGSNNYVNASSIYYTAGYYPITIRYVEWGGGAYAKLAWSNSNSITSRSIVPTTNLFTELPNTNSIETCPGQLITELDGALATSTSSDSGTIPSFTTYYYYFTPSVEGTLQVNSSMGGYTNELYIREGCASTILWSATNDSNDKSSPEVNIAANQLIVIEYVRDYGSSQNYNIDFTYTVPTAPEMGDIPDQIGSVGAAFSLDISSYVTGTATGYTLTGTLPNGLSWNATTGIINGTPTDETAQTSFTVTATNDVGTSNEDSFTITIQAAQTETIGGRDFAQRTQTSIFGDIRVIGNTVLCKHNSSGACVEPTSTSDSNADTDLQKAPNSYSTLTIPTGAVITYARIYWQGRQDSDSDTTWSTTSKNSASTIGVRKGNSGAFTSLYADIKDFDSTGGNIRTYSVSADAINIVDGSGVYYIDTANFYTTVGDTSDGLGAYGAWVLVVIYEDPNETKARNITIFDGYKQVTASSGDIDITVNGFLTPQSGVVDSSTYVFTAEGDKYIQGDKLKMAGLTYNTSLSEIGTFNSRVDVDGTRSPNLTNNNGIDIHKYDTGTTSGALGIIDTNEVGAKFQFTSTQDTYFPSLIVFSTELYLPQMCYDYSIKQDGSYLKIDRAAYPIAQIDSYISSSPLEVTVYLRNEEADIAAEGIAIKADNNDTVFDHTGHILTSNINGSALIDRGAPSNTDPLCDYDKNGNNSISNNGCTTGHDFRKGNGSLSAGEYIYTKYTLSPKNISGLADVNQSLGLSLKYYITADGNKVEYPDYVLGGVNVPLCPPSTMYTPVWGDFNVVHSGLTTNNLHTQIARNPFETAVIFDSTPDTGNNEAPTTDVNTTVLVEVIDVNSFGDLNASCPKPDARLTDPIFMPIGFSPTAYQTNIPIQDNSYYNFAVENAAYRVWQFNNADGTLIQNWTASTTNNGKTVTAISGLYSQTEHPLCSSACTSPESTTCFDCVMMNYAEPTCSRDNFSVRPESYDLRIYDINATAATPTDQDTTKVDLSTQYGFDPTSASTTNTISLASEYTYRFDINTTGHDGIARVPGYTRIFNTDPYYNAVMYWNPSTAKTNCGNIDDEVLTIYIADGTVQNSQQSHLEAGEYNLNIVDESWTAVDWQATSHHTAADSFLTSDDCNQNTSSSTLTNDRYGCKISTDHGFVDHDNDGVGESYQDHDLIFHPYKFGMTDLNMTVGTNDTPLTPNAFLYMSDISQVVNEPMSLHFTGDIIAQGLNGGQVSNFVNGCYAQNIELNVSKTDSNLTASAGGSVPFLAIYHNRDTANATVAAQDISTVETTHLTDLNIAIPSTYFRADLNGTLNSALHINYTKENNNSVNPMRLEFFDYKVDCNPSTNCQFNSDLVNDKTTKGERAIDSNVTYYYGRTNAPRQRFVGNTGDALVYYEAYCSATTVGTDCNRTLLPNGILSVTVDDPRWYVNPNHDTANDGVTGVVAQKNGAGIVTPGANDNSVLGETKVPLTYDETKGYPYKTTMTNTPSPWLIYNRYNANAVANDFTVEFVNTASQWSGLHESNNTSTGNAAPWTNRRVDW